MKMLTYCYEFGITDVVDAINEMTEHYRVKFCELRDELEEPIQNFIREYNKSGCTFKEYFEEFNRYEQKNILDSFLDEILWIEHVRDVEVRIENNEVSFVTPFELEGMSVSELEDSLNSCDKLFTGHLFDTLFNNTDVEAYFKAIVC